jgi:hypothetical protein
MLLLAAGAPLPALAASPTESIVPGAAAPALTVVSEPAGAAVYLDGAFHGETPVAVDRVGAGDHRVRVVKDGYLENSRVVSVPAKGARSVNVKLTPRAGQASPAYQVEPSSQGGGGGGGKKVLLIGLGVVAVGAGVYLATRNTNKPPTVSGVTASPAVGLQSVTSITFNAAASDPDGDALTYTWNFGDGSTGSGASASHVFATSGTFNVSVEVSDAKNLKATGSGSVTIKSLSGRWGAILAGNSVFAATWNLQQSGTSISGNYSDPFNGSGTAGGSVSSPNNVSLTNSIPGFVTGRWTGTLNGDFTRITGTVDWFTGGPRAFTMDRR